MATDNFNTGVPAANLGGNFTTGTGSTTFTKVAPGEARTGSGSAVWWNADAFDDDHWSEVTLGAVVDTGTSAQGGVGPCWRHQSGAQTFYYVQANAVSANRLHYGKRVAGVHTPIGVNNTGAIPATGTIIRGGAEGNTQRVYQAGTELFTFTDSSIPTGGAPGLAGDAFNEFGTIDAWEGSNFAGPEPTTGRFILATGVATDYLLLASGGTDYLLLAGGDDVPGGTQFPQTVTGTVTAAQIAGGAVLQVRVLKAGTVSAAQNTGALAKRAGKILTGTQATIGGALAKRVAKLLTGAQDTITGALAPVKMTLRALSSTHAQASTAGAVTRRTGKTVGATHAQASTAGALSRRVAKVLAGAQASSGALARTLVKLLDVGSTITAPQIAGAVSRAVRRVLGMGSSHSATSGGLVKRVARLLGSSQATSNGGLTKRVAKGVASTQAAIGGTLVRILVKLLAIGSTHGTTAGALARRAGKVVGGSVSPGPGTLTKQARLLRGGTMLQAHVSGALAAGRRFVRALASTVLAAQIAGLLRRRTDRLLGGAVAPGGTLVKLARKTLTGTLQPTGGASTYQSQDVEGTLASPSGTLTKRILLAFLGTQGSAGALDAGKRVQVIVGGALEPIGLLVYVADIIQPLFYDRLVFRPDTIARVAFTQDTRVTRQAIAPDTIVTATRLLPNTGIRRAFTWTGAAGTLPPDLTGTPGHGFSVQSGRLEGAGGALRMVTFAMDGPDVRFGTTWLTDVLNAGMVLRWTDDAHWLGLIYRNDTDRLQFIRYNTHAALIAPQIDLGPIVGRYIEVVAEGAEYTVLVDGAVRGTFVDVQAMNISAARFGFLTNINTVGPAAFGATRITLI